MVEKWSSARVVDQDMELRGGTLLGITGQALRRVSEQCVVSLLGFLVLMWTPESILRRVSGSWLVSYLGFLVLASSPIQQEYSSRIVSCDQKPTEEV